MSEVNLLTGAFLFMSECPQRQVFAVLTRTHWEGMMFAAVSLSSKELASHLRLQNNL